MITRLKTVAPIIGIFPSHDTSSTPIVPFEVVVDFFDAGLVAIGCLKNKGTIEKSKRYTTRTKTRPKEIK